MIFTPFQATHLIKPADIEAGFVRFEHGLGEAPHRLNVMLTDPRGLTETLGPEHVNIGGHDAIIVKTPKHFVGCKLEVWATGRMHGDTFADPPGVSGVTPFVKEIETW